jgi:hypothetical protein
MLARIEKGLKAKRPGVAARAFDNETLSLF